jgi:inosine-uridine nucleoside N-ribohydrolase
MGAMVFLVLWSALAAPVPVILDTDIGDDIDDTWALCLMLGSPEVEVKLIVTASDDTPVKTRLLAKILERVGRTDIPIGTGKRTSDRAIHQAGWLGDYDLSSYPGVVHSDGVQALIDAVHAHKGRKPITLCVIGPQTNLGAALERDPSIAGRARVVAMAGSVHVGYDGAAQPQPEWNVHRDIAAIRAVFGAPWEIRLAPLDVCGTLRLSGGRYLRVRDSASPLARVLIENYEAWTHRGQYAADASSVLFDTVAVYLCFSERLVQMKRVPLRIDDAGNTVVAEGDGRATECALGWRDRDAFEALLVERLTR